MIVNVAHQARQLWGFNRQVVLACIHCSELDSSRLVKLLSEHLETQKGLSVSSLYFLTLWTACIVFEKEDAGCGLWVSVEALKV